MHPTNLLEDAARIVTIKYTNYRGEHKTYRVIPHAIHFGKSEFHDGIQWFLNATDVDRNVLRNFAMKDIASWKLPATASDLPSTILDELPSLKNLSQPGKPAD